MSSTHPSAAGSVVSAQEQRLWINLLKQAKFIALGSALVWYFETHEHVAELWNLAANGGSFTNIAASKIVGNSTQLSLGPGWARILALVTFLFLAFTVATFAILMLLPLAGHKPDFSAWHQDTILRNLIPLLTFSLVAGFSVLSAALTLIPRATTGLGIFSLLGKKVAGGKLSNGETQIIGHSGWLQRASVAFAGATGVYLLILGTVGLLGVFVVPIRKNEKAKRQ